MPNKQVFATAALAVFLFGGVMGIWHSMKKAGQNVGCVVMHGHKCSKYN